MAVNESTCTLETPWVPEVQGVKTMPLNQKAKRIIIEPRKRLETVKIRRTDSYWQDKSWIKKGDTYQGRFGFNGHSCPGTVIWGKRGLKDCFIAHPPRELWESEHRACFFPRGNGNYLVHFHKVPRSVDATILTVENVLNKAITGKRG